MRRITALKVQARNRNRVNVFLDGRFAFGLVKIAAARLRIGQELSEADIDRLRQSDASERNYESALRLLSYRPRSEAEIRLHLKKRGIPDEEVEGVLARLRRAGLTDDEGFARYWVDNRSAFRPKGRRALRAELRAKGLPAQVIEQALADLDDAAVADQLAAARAPRLKSLPPLEFKRRLGGYLARRGLDYGIISAAVERAWRAHGGSNHSDGNTELVESED